MRSTIQINRKSFVYLVPMAALFVVLNCVPTFGQRAPQHPIRAGEVIKVRMEDNLSTRTARRGQTFETSVMEPVMSTNGQLVIPRGSIINGRIVAYQRPERRRKPGTIDVKFVSIKFPNGRTVPFEGSLSSLEDNEGQITGESRSRGRVMFVGATGGAVIGALTGGVGSTIAGGLFGATGALLTRRFTSGAHAEVNRNDEIGVYVDRRFYLPTYR